MVDQGSVSFWTINQILSGVGFCLWCVTRYDIWTDGRESPLKTFSDHLRECAGEDRCPLKDSIAHIWLERILWWPISKFGTAGTIFSFVLVGLAFAHITLVDAACALVGRKRLFNPD